MYGKKGMSPLIATILLMAFAVAIGAVIMNWAGPEGDSDCSETGLELTIKQFCVADGTLLFEVRNTGEIGVEELILQFSKDGATAELAVENARLGQGQTITRNIPAVFGGEAQVNIIPSIQNRGLTVMCSEPIKTYPRIPNC